MIWLPCYYFTFRTTNLTTNKVFIYSVKVVLLDAHFVRRHRRWNEKLTKHFAIKLNAAGFWVRDESVYIFNMLCLLLISFYSLVSFFSMPMRINVYVAPLSLSFFLSLAFSFSLSLSSSLFPFRFLLLRLLASYRHFPFPVLPPPFCLPVLLFFLLIPFHLRFLFICILKQKFGMCKTMFNSNSPAENRYCKYRNSIRIKYATLSFGKLCNSIDAHTQSKWNFCLFSIIRKAFHLKHAHL